MAVIDLFGLFVNGLFGSVLMATVFIVLSFWIFGGFMRMGALLITAISGLYTMIILTTWYGGIFGVLAFLAVSIYFIVSILPFFGTMWER